jgi:hypothetical protein
MKNAVPHLEASLISDLPMVFSKRGRHRSQDSGGADRALQDKAG